MESTTVPPLSEPNHQKFRLAEQLWTRWSCQVTRIEKGSGKEAAASKKNSVPQVRKI
jgi:hypothetical protein